MSTQKPEQIRQQADKTESVAEGLDHLADRIVLRRSASALRTAADQLEAVQEALARHPKCDKYDDDDVVSCGWMSAVRDISWAVNQ